VTIRNSFINGSGGVGLSATSCDVTVDQTIVQNNAGGGVQLANSDFTLQNLVIAANGTGGGSGTSLGGVQVNGTGTSSRAQIVNVTVADNSSKSTGTYSAFDCVGGATPIIFNAAVTNNSNNQINPACSLDHSSYPGGSGTNHDITGCTDAQLFTTSGANFYQPLSTATAPCVLVGKGTTSYMSVTAPNYDLLGAARSAPPSDGAYE
jgi:hypothetical protein